jgi:hypothetical protein
MSLASALDAILKAVAFGWPQADDLIVSALRGSRKRWNEFDGLFNLEFVRQRHREDSLATLCLAFGYN